MSTQAYTFTASSALLNVPVNMVQMVLSMPAWEVQAMNRFADAMIGTGSWQVWGPTNVFGFDEWDPPKLAGLIDMMMPVQPFSSVLGEQMNTWAKANLPMNTGCAAIPGACPDGAALVKGSFKVQTSQLNEGYQFPTVTNSFTLQPTAWSGQYVKLDPLGAFTSLSNYLTGEPRGVQNAPIEDYVSIPAKLAKSVFDGFYPFVQNSEWFNPKQSVWSLAFRALAPITCPSCGPEPYANPWLYENYPPKPAPAHTTPASAATVVVAEAVSAPGDTVVPKPPAPADPSVSPPADRAADRVDIPEPDIAEPASTVPDTPASGTARSTADVGVNSHRGPVGADRSSTATQGRSRGPSAHSEKE